MPFDSDSDSLFPHASLRAAMLDLISREARRPTLDEAGMRAALRMIVARSRGSAGELWVKYNGGRNDRQCRDLGRYGD